MSQTPDTRAVRAYLLALQARIVAQLEALDDKPFHTDRWTRPEGGEGITRVIEGGSLFERGGVNFSHVFGDKLPPSATAARPELAGSGFEAMGVSLVLHPRNPYCPTVHMNVRFFAAKPRRKDSGPEELLNPSLPLPLSGEGNHRAAQEPDSPLTRGAGWGSEPPACSPGAKPPPVGAKKVLGRPGDSLERSATTEAPTWWFGGGMDLTPYYGFADDVRHFHATCKAAVQPFGAELHPRFKAWCDKYFHLKHRNEARGVGGLFFDDFNEAGFEQSFALTRSVGDAFLPAYLPILERRRAIPWGERERDFQAYRRGRYVEFNLVFDRGTLFGLQSGGRTESILMSMPPEVKWRYDWQPEPGSAEAALYTDFLPPREWV